ncbi:MAG: hypothetical protein ACRDRT_07090 [Pseudonocardiaceae bacterium]
MSVIEIMLDLPVELCRMCDGTGLVHWDGVSLLPSNTSNPEAESCLACATISRSTPALASAVSF